MSKTPKQEAPDKGIYLQRKVYWYRYSFGGRQHFLNLRTTDLADAIEKKRHLIATGALMHSGAVKKAWEKAVDDYLEEKVAKGKIRKAYVGKTKSALMVFQDFCKAATPSAVKLSDLQKYYDTRRKKSEAGARSSVNTVQSFLNHLGLLHKRVEFVSNSRPESRQEIATMTEMNSWIDACSQKNERKKTKGKQWQDLKFVLFCLANCGMRAGEVKHACVEWFNKGLVNIPAKQTYRDKDGTLREWRTKDNDARQIPIPPKMREFLDQYLKGKKGLVIKSNRSKDGLWDFKKPLAEHMEKVGRPEFYPHAFRHSWVTAMMNEGKTIQQVSAWSGDSLQTLEKNYWKKKVLAGETDDVVSGIKKQTEAEKKLERIEAQLTSLASLVCDAKAAKGEAIDEEEAIYVMQHESDFVAQMINDLIEQHNTAKEMHTMTPEQREEFLNSLPF
jgi:integrase